MIKISRELKLVKVMIRKFESYYVKLLSMLININNLTVILNNRIYFFKFGLKIDSVLFITVWINHIKEH